MKITALYIDGFGMFTDYHLEALAPGVNILFGPNEAGKSTLLQFIRYTLFGYPRPLDQRLPPLFGGRHGGRIAARLSDGTEVTFARTAGYPGTITLHYPETTSDSEGEWFRLLGNASGALFENVYGISLEELLGLESLSRSGVEDRIFSVGLGLQGVSLGEVEKALVKEAEAIYKPRGSRQVIPELTRQLNREMEERDRIQAYMPRYRELGREIRELKSRLENLEKELAVCQADHDRLHNYLKCYPSYVTLCQVSEELAHLPEFRDLPEDGRDQLNRLEEREAALQKTIAGAETERERLEASLAGTDYNADLLAQAGKFEEMSANFEKYKAIRQQYDEDAAEQARLRDSIRQGLQAFPPGWGEKEIAVFSDIITHRDRLETFRRQWEDVDRRTQQARQDVTALAARQRLLSPEVLLLVLSLLALVGIVPCLLTEYFIPAGGLGAAAVLFFWGRGYLRKTNPLDAARRHLAALEVETQKVREASQTYLQTCLGFVPELSPSAALEALQMVERLQREIISGNRLAARLDGMERFLRDFEQLTEDLASCLPDVAPEQEVAVRVAVVSRHFRENQSRREQRARLEESLRKNEAVRARARQEEAALAQELARLLESAAADNREEFRKRYRDNERVAALLVERRQAMAVIRQIAGVEKAEEVRNDLASSEKSRLDNQLAALEQQVADLNRERDEINREISARQAQQRELAGTSELTEVMTRLEVTREQLRQAYQEWLAAQTALSVLQTVKQKFEQERQPAVIRNSSRYFRDITDGQYERIRVSLEDRAVSVFDRSRREKRLEQLSRGTREQLLISLRLGFIEEYEQTAEPLPLVLDDVLVNFDAARGRRTAAVLQDFARDRQVLFFTCHPGVPELFQKDAVNINNLQPG